MKNILKRNQIMITALAIMIAVAGYLNFAGSKVNEEELALVNSDSVTNEQYEVENGILTNDLEEAAYLDEIGTFDISAEDIAAIIDIESLDGDVDVISPDYLTEGMTEVTETTSLPAADEGTPGEAVFASTSNITSLSGAKLLKEQTRAKNKETLLEIINNSNIDNAQKQVAIDNMIRLTDIAEKETAAEILLEAKGFPNTVVSVSGTYVDVMVNSVQLTDAERAQIVDIVTRKTEMAAENIIITPIGSE